MRPFIFIAALGTLAAAPAAAQGMCCSYSGDGIGGTTCCPGGSCCGAGPGCGRCGGPAEDPPPSNYSCPDTHPVDCGTGKCCASAFPVCCKEGRCAISQAACDGPVCPDTHKVDCGNGNCCREQFPVCCAGGGCCSDAKPICCGNGGGCCDRQHPFCCSDGSCASSQSGCPKDDCPRGYARASGSGSNSRCCPSGYSYYCNDGSCDLTPNCHGAGLFGSRRPKPISGGTGGSGGGGGGTCAPGAPGVQCQSLTSCSRCTLQNCGGQNGSGCAFYRASDGTTFGTTCRADQSCVQAAANQALRYCGCI